MSSFFWIKGKESEGSPKLKARPKHGVESARARKCAICESRQPDKVEIYQFRDELDVYLFRNDMAKQLAADGRSAAPIAAGALLHLVGLLALMF